MDESVAMLAVVAALVFGIWLVDYSGESARVSTGVAAAASEAAHYTAEAVASAPPRLTQAQLEAHADEIAAQVVGGAAIGNCDTRPSSNYSVNADLHRLPGQLRPAAVSVQVTCPLAVSPLYKREATAQVAVPVPDRP